MNDPTTNPEFAKLSFNAKLLLKELQWRDVGCKELGDTFVIKASYGDHHELLYDVYTALTPYPQGLMIDDKYYAKRLLQKYGFMVPEGRFFGASQKKQALEYAGEIGYPVVIKPTVGTHGTSVYVDIRTKEELSRHIEHVVNAPTGNGYYLVERHIEGSEYRLFITKDGFFAAVERVPANIIGDGMHPLRELVKQENYRRMHPRNTCLCEIVLDDVVDAFLKKSHKDLDYIPKINERVHLRQNSNVSTGGNCYGVTEHAHPSFRELAENVRSALDVPFVGLDVLTAQDISESLKSYAICELNGSPGLSLHMMPESGTPQNAAGALADILFPETKK